MHAALGSSLYIEKKSEMAAGVMVPGNVLARRISAVQGEARSETRLWQVMVRYPPSQDGFGKPILPLEHLRCWVLGAMQGSL